MIKNIFLGFIEKVKRSKKEILRCMLKLIEHDCRSNTGRNLRQIGLERDALPYNAPYHEIPTTESWRLSIIEEIIATRTGTLSSNMTFKELDDICDFVCES